MRLSEEFGLVRGNAVSLSIDLARAPVVEHAQAQRHRVAYAQREAIRFGADLVTRFPPWRWLRNGIERLLAPIDFEPFGCEHEFSSHPEEMTLARARSPVSAHNNSTTDHDPIGSTQCEGAALKLANGRSIRVRPVRPADADGVQNFVRRLSDTSRSLRFFAPIRELAPTMLARLVGSAGRCGRVFVAEAHEGHATCIVALAEYAAGDNGETCELGLVVADAWQHLGLGHLLMGMLIQAARAARFLRAVADVLYGNVAMVALGRAHDFAVARSPHGSTMLRLVRDL